MMSVDEYSHSRLNVEPFNEKYRVNIFCVCIQFTVRCISFKNMAEADEQIARLQGYYKVLGHRAQFLKVDGTTATLKDTHETFVLSSTISYGDFGREVF